MNHVKRTSHCPTYIYEMGGSWNEDWHVQNWITAKALSKMKSHVLWVSFLTRHAKKDWTVDDMMTFTLVHSTCSSNGEADVLSWLDLRGRIGISQIYSMIWLHTCIKDPVACSYIHHIPYDRQWDHAHVSKANHLPKCETVYLGAADSQ